MEGPGLEGPGRQLHGYDRQRLRSRDEASWPKDEVSGLMGFKVKDSKA